MAQVTLDGNPLNTNGDLPAVGATAPDFRLVDAGFPRLIERQRDKIFELGAADGHAFALDSLVQTGAMDQTGAPDNAGAP